MLIAINCWTLRNKQLDGIGNFTIETLKRLIPANPGIQFLIMADRNFTEDYFDFKNVTIHKVFPPYRHPVLYFLYMETMVRSFLKKHKPDLFLSMDGFLSLSSSCKQLPVIYDLNFEHYPQDHTFKNRIYYRTFFKRFAAKAVRIATISEYTKQDIQKWYGINPGFIDNVSCGIKEKFSPLIPEEKIAVRQQFNLQKDYFFFVGSMHPRKNIMRLLTAFENFKKETGSDIKLVLSGHILWDDKSIEKVTQEMSFRNDVVFTGRVSDDELKGLLGSALALTFVPTFEGFGLPIVEAFQCGVPVICSTTTSMPEVAGNAALLADPFDIASISKAMKTMYNNKDLREELIQKGFKRKTLFTWQRTADLLWSSIEKAVK